MYGRLSQKVKVVRRTICTAGRVALEGSFFLEERLEINFVLTGRTGSWYRPTARWSLKRFSLVETVSFFRDLSRERFPLPLGGSVLWLIKFVFQEVTEFQWFFEYVVHGVYTIRCY